MKHVKVFLNNKILLIVIAYNPKKGRKNSTPNPAFTVVTSPDGVLISFFILSLGSFSVKYLRINFESAIGIVSTCLTILVLSISPLISTISLDNLNVALGAILVAVVGTILENK
jgi:hypothetical protein